MNGLHTIVKRKSGEAAKLCVSGNAPTGFALIATILVLSLLMVIALASISISSVEGRSSQQGVHELEAKANARLAMMLALAELQKSMGPDQRVNAVSQILEPDPAALTSTLANPWLTGVWSSRNDVLGSQPDYSRDKPFQRWLISGENADSLKDINFAATGSFSDPVELVGKYTAGESKPNHYVVAGKIKVGQGKAAWWIGDENSKALSFPRNIQEQEGTMKLADHLAGFATPGVHGIKSLAALEAIETNTANADKVISNGQLAFYSDSEIGSDTRPNFYDLTTFSQSVLCNVSKGGLRKDLNLFLEKDSKWLDNWPAWPRGPNGKIALSPQDEYDVLSWRHLHHHYHSQRMVNYVNGRPQLTHIRSNAGTNAITNPKWNSGVTRPSLVPVRVQLFLALGSIQDKNNPTKYNLRLYMYPVMTLWNPYNVDLKVDGYHLLLNTLPLKHTISLNGIEKQTYGWASGVNNQVGVGTVLSIRNITFKAGESMVFSPTKWGPEPGGTNTHYYHDMQPIDHDYSAAKPGSTWGVGDKGVVDAPLTISGVSSDKVTIKTLANNFDDGDGAYQFLQSTFGWRGQDLYSGDGRWPTYLWSSKVAWRHENGNPRPDEFSSNNKAQDTLGNLLDAPRPFCVVDAHLKTLDEGKLMNKTWLHTIPVHSYAGVTSQKKGGDSHTSYYSSAYDVDFKQVNSYEEVGEYVQRVPGDDKHGYFGSSYTTSGQTYITGRELPLVPMTSLAQLQNLPQHPIDAMHWSGFGLQNNAIANSFASPAIESDSVKTSAIPYYLNGYINNVGGYLDGRKVGLSDFVSGTSTIDRSYAANHLLWDEYYFSSMAAQDGSFYKNNGSSKNLREVVSEFYKDNPAQLPNARYLAYLGGKSADAIVESLVTEKGVATDEGYKKSASHLMVSGGFNINSTSEVAWANLIASAHLKRPVVLEAKSADKPSLESEGKFIVSRYTLPNGKLTSAGGDDLKWRSYRELTSKEINQLAKAMVVQVKTRGPFRSLGEFINRRLGSSSDETSLYGALQAALEDPSVDINKDFRSDKITDADIKDATYKFKEAALGPKAQGAPAYVTQADILQPIAPIITARSDTFIIRSYGESLSPDGKNIMARAWCESVVQRYPEYVDATDSSELEYSDLTSELNKKFGRRFKIVSFRWLAEGEI